jgi:hypothetical protein
VRNISRKWNHRIFPSADISRILFACIIPIKSLFNMPGITFLLNVKYPPTERVGFVHELTKSLNFKCGYIWIVSWKIGFYFGEDSVLDKHVAVTQKENGLSSSANISQEPLVFTLRLPLEGFSWNILYEYFRKSVKRTQGSLKHDKSNEYFTWRSMYTCESILLNSY